MASAGQKISKSKNNAKSDPIALIDTYSADVVRYWSATGSLGRDILFNEEKFKIGARLVNKLYNASKFVWLFIENFDAKKVDVSTLMPIDRWIISKFTEMQAKYKDYFEKYEVGLAMSELESFFWNFCDNYIELVKVRLYNEDKHTKDEINSGKYALYTVLLEMLKMFGVYLPHVTEEIYQNTYKQMEGVQSVHNMTFSELLPCDKELNALGDEVCEIVGLARGYKTDNKISLKTPLTKVTITSPNVEFIKSCEGDIKEASGALEIEYVTSDKKSTTIHGHLEEEE